MNPGMPLSSVGASNGNVPFGALRAGTDTDGHALYMCSASYAGLNNPQPDRSPCVT
jgi:hypothetical protein